MDCITRYEKVFASRAKSPTPTRSVPTSPTHQRKSWRMLQDDRICKREEGLSWDSPFALYCQPSCHPVQAGQIVRKVLTPLHAIGCAGHPCSRLFLTERPMLNERLGFADTNESTEPDRPQLLGMWHQCMLLDGNHPNVLEANDFGTVSSVYRENAASVS